MYYPLHGGWYADMPVQPMELLSVGGMSTYQQALFSKSKELHFFFSLYLSYFYSFSNTCKNMIENKGCWEGISFTYMDILNLFLSDEQSSPAPEIKSASIHPFKGQSEAANLWR